MKCEKCGKKIQYNRYKKVKGKYYCPECVPKKIENCTAYKKFEIDDEAEDALNSPTQKARKQMQAEFDKRAEKQKAMEHTPGETTAIEKTIPTDYTVLVPSVFADEKPKKKYKKRKAKKVE